MVIALPLHLEGCSLQALQIYRVAQLQLSIALDELAETLYSLSQCNGDCMSATILFIYLN